MSALYRGAGIVPATGETTTSGIRWTRWSRFIKSIGADGSVEPGRSWAWSQSYSAGGSLIGTYITFTLNGSVNATYFGVGTGPIHDRGGQQWEKGGLFKTITAEDGARQEWYSTRVRTREAYSRTIISDINTQVPSSGKLSASNFYGARNS